MFTAAVIETNLTGPWLMSTLAYNMWMRDNGGSIVVITAAPHDRVGDPVRPITVTFAEVAVAV